MTMVSVAGYTIERIPLSGMNGYACAQCDMRKKGNVTCASKKYCDICVSLDETDSENFYVFKKKK